MDSRTQHNSGFLRSCVSEVSPPFLLCNGHCKFVMFYLILNTCETHEKIKLVASLAKNVLHSYCIVLRTSVLSVSVYRCATSPITSQTAVCCATSSTTTTPLSSLSTSSTSTPLSLRCGTQALGLKRRLLATSLFKGIVVKLLLLFLSRTLPNYVPR